MANQQNTNNANNNTNNDQANKAADQTNNQANNQAASFSLDDIQALLDKKFDNMAQGMGNGVSALLAMQMAAKDEMQQHLVALAKPAAPVEDTNDKRNGILIGVGSTLLVGSLVAGGLYYYQNHMQTS